MTGYRYLDAHPLVAVADGDVKTRGMWVDLPNERGTLERRDLVPPDRPWTTLAVIGVPRDGFADYETFGRDVQYRWLPAQGSVGMRTAPKPPQFSMWCDSVETTNSIGTSTPDPEWVYVDAAGHIHVWFDGSVTNAVLIDRLDEDGEWDTMVWNCAHCGEHLAPGYIYTPPSAYRTFLPGMTHYAIDGVEVTPDEYAAALEAARVGSAAGAEPRV